MAPPRIAQAAVSIGHKPFEPGSHLEQDREALIGEYLAKKAAIMADCPQTDEGQKMLHPRMLAGMNGREAAGMFLRTYGANALRAFNALMDRPARRRYEKTFPGVGDLLRKHCPEGSA